MPRLSDILAGQQAGRAARDEAVARVDANADERWKEYAARFIRHYARTHETFTASDVYMAMMVHPREPRAMGPAMTRASNAGEIEMTNEFRTSSNPSSHAGNARVWRSLIFNGQGDINGQAEG